VELPQEVARGEELKRANSNQRIYVDLQVSYKLLLIKSGTGLLLPRPMPRGREEGNMRPEDAQVGDGEMLWAEDEGQWVAWPVDRLLSCLILVCSTLSEDVEAWADKFCR
jgi:hypothetical protein